MIQWHDLRFTIGMPHMVPGRLSEVELLKVLGSFQWDSISALLGLPSSRIVNALDERLYASFINIDLRFPAGQGQDSFDEGSTVHVRNGISVYANKFIEGLTLFSGAPIPAGATEDITGCADLARADCPSAYLTNAFVTRMAGNTRLKVFEPSTMKTRDVPRAKSVPPGIAEHEVVQFTGQVPDDGPPADWVPLRVRSEEPVRYAIVPESDLNGAGLLYFARYVAMMNYAERVFLTDRLVSPWTSQLVATLSTERRRIYYFANADPGDTVRAVVTGQVLVDETARAAAPASRRGTHVKLLFRLALSRASDNNLMAVALVRKSLSIPGHEKGLIAESERFLAHQGLRTG
ncbi:MAG TPA: LnmK family bifunctional acyltransferase/decarboxylase [Planctomycetota bacterium]|nr:LnmK family bifunctional acyltransferase/decarboxylase [Planctomycetota bacterium]